MPARAAWKGFLRVNQLSVPVKAFTAVATGPEIPLNQLHSTCGQRIRQQKHCPVHGPISPEEIISGFEFAQNQYLPLQPGDLDALQPEDQKAIGVECFVPQTDIDPVYHSGRTYYLVPDGPPGQRPFCVLRDGMRHNQRHAVALVVLGGSETLVLLRPLIKVVAMTVLEYPQRVRPTSDYETEVMGITSSETEQRLIGELIDSMTERELDLNRYRDSYTDRLTQLIQDRLADHNVPALITAREGDEESDLVSAIMESLATAGASGHRNVPIIHSERSHSGTAEIVSDLSRKSG